MLKRHFSTFLLGFYALLALLFLSWSADPLVRTLKHTFFYFLSPVSSPILTEMNKWGDFGHNAARLLTLDQENREFKDKWERHLLQEETLQELQKENERLKAILKLPPRSTYEVLPARIFARDANDWFHSLLLRRGRRDGIALLDPVVAVQNDREVLVGQIVEVLEETCRALLITDPLSAVSARVERTGEEGAVEGMGTNRLVLNYLFSDSDVAVGDTVVTAGLGEVFPPGVLVGTIESVESGPRNLFFKRAFLTPALRFNRMEEVVILHRKDGR